jgi:hypothetical protein
MGRFSADSPSTGELIAGFSCLVPRFHLAMGKVRIFLPSPRYKGNPCNEISVNISCRLPIPTKKLILHDYLIVTWSINPLLGFTLLNQASFTRSDQNYGSHIRIVNSHIL